MEYTATDGTDFTNETNNKTIMMRRIILFTLFSLLCLSSHGQNTYDNKQAVVYYEYKTFDGFHRYTYSSDGHTPMRRGTKICLSLVHGNWYIYGYMNEREDTVMVTEKEALKVDKMIRKVDWEAFHPEADERLVKSECDDCIQWSVNACTFRGECHVESDGEMSGYIEPEKAARRYHAAMRRIHKINRYLFSFLRF